MNKIEIITLKLVYTVLRSLEKIVNSFKDEYNSYVSSERKKVFKRKS